MTPTPAQPFEPSPRRVTTTRCPDCGRALRIVQQTRRRHRMKPGWEIVEFFARCQRLIPHRFVAWVEVRPNGEIPDPVFTSTSRS
jgi:hypothetical protein